MFIFKMEMHQNKGRFCVLSLVIREILLLQLQNHDLKSADFFRPKNFSKLQNPSVLIT